MPCCCPAPPHELKAMFERQCLPRLLRIVPKQIIRTLFLRITGMPESDLDALISPVYQKYDNPVTTILAAAGDLQVHLRAPLRHAGGSRDALLAGSRRPHRPAFGRPHLFPQTADPLETVVGNLLRTNHATVSVAESCTAGMLGERFTTVSRQFGLLSGRFHHL